MAILYNIIVILFGLVIGSFLNVCIHRIPKKLSIILPASYCPKCKGQIRFYDNIPVLSYIILKGKCRYCKKNISFLYPFIEIITGIFFLLIFNKFDFRSDLISIITYLMFVSILIVITFIDIKHYIIPDKLNIILLSIGIITLIFNRFPFYGLSFPEKVISSLTGILTGGGIWLVITLIGNKIYLKRIGKEAMGLGDVKLFAAIGSFFTAKIMLANMYLAVIIGGVSSLIIMLFFKKGLKDQIPFGPFIAVSAIIIVLYYDTIFSIFNTIFLRGY